MANIHDFDEIRPYLDEEISDVLKRIARERGFLNFIKSFFPEQSTKKIIQSILKISKRSDFQKYWVYPLVERIIHSSVSKLTFSGLNNIQKDKPYLFISNHRDIVLDSALMQYVLMNNEYQTSQVAIGSNLLIMQWIVDLVKLNRSFIVKRDVPKIELYHYSVNLSQYIRFLITEQKESVWLAQREGRTKDGDDKTQPAVLKMLNLSGANSLFEDIKELNIIPVSISYEFEPMDSAKVQESYDRKLNPKYEKEKLDDLNSMDGGIEKKKGHIHYHFGTPLNETIHKIEHITKRKEKYVALTELLNKEIHKNYRLTTFNYIAADIYFKTKEYAKHYTEEDKTTFDNYFKKSVADLKGEEEVLKEMFLKIYATPVKNYFNSIQE